MQITKFNYSSKFMIRNNKIIVICDKIEVITKSFGKTDSLIFTGDWHNVQLSLDFPCCQFSHILSRIKDYFYFNIFIFCWYKVNKVVLHKYLYNFGYLIFLNLFLVLLEI